MPPTLPGIGIAVKLPSREHMRRGAARRLWLALKERGWRPVKPQWGADVDP